MMRCGRCNSRMISFTQGKGRWRFYLCGSYHHAGSCGWCSLPQQKIEELVFAKIREHVLLGSRKPLEASIQKVLNRRKQRAAPIVRKSDIDKLERQIAKATEWLLLIDEDLLDGAQRKLRELKSRRDAMVAANVATVKNAKSPTAREIAADAWRLDEVLRTASPSAVRHALSQIIAEIRLDFEERGSTAKNRKFRCTGGEIKLQSSVVSHTSGADWPGGCTPHRRTNPGREVHSNAIETAIRKADGCSSRQGSRGQCDRSERARSSGETAFSSMFAKQTSSPKSTRRERGA